MMERITARKNPLLQQVRKLVSSRKERESTGLFVADGTKLLAEAVKWWPGLETVILSDGVEADVPSHVRVVSVPKDVMESISPMRSPQGALFLCRLPEKTPFQPQKGMLILDGIQDPGNLGTIVRTAEAAGVSAVFLNRESVDLYNPKTIRSTMGSIYRMPVIYVENLVELLQKFKKKGVQSYAAHLEGRNAYDAENYTTGTAILIGNEGNGLSQEVADQADIRVRIPMEGKVESLNAAIAASVLMFEVYRQRR